MNKRTVFFFVAIFAFGCLKAAEPPVQKWDTIVSPFYNGFAKITVEHVGIIDTTGREVLPIWYFDAPEYFGENQFRPMDPHSPDCIGYVVDYDESAVWFDSKGTVLVTEGKPFYGVADTIPDILWNY